MRLSENAAAADTLVNAAWIAQQQRQDRLDGVHVSDLTLCARRAWYHGQGYQEDYDPRTKLLFLVGQGHHAVVQAITEVPGALGATAEVPIRYVKPGMLVHGTVDLLLQEDPGVEIVCEIKTTRASSDKDPEQSSHYLEQVACYCVTLGVTRARLYIVHLMGNYREVRTPVLTCWDIEFSPEELARWEAEMARRHALITGADPPAPYEAYGWECGYCPFLAKNGGICPGGGLRVPFFLRERPPIRISLQPGEKYARDRLILE